jgi:hypothetical protein
MQVGRNQRIRLDIECTEAIIYLTYLYLYNDQTRNDMSNLIHTNRSVWQYTLALVTSLWPSGEWGEIVLQPHRMQVRQTQSVRLDITK